MVDYLIGAGIKPTSIVSYNHLGNNDGKNLQEHKMFRSKEISKSNVVDDMISSNELLYKPNEHPDHVVVIKYVENVGDSKRAMDEYTSDIFMNGKNTLVIHNTCEDSLLAAPIILDMITLVELITRVTIKMDDNVVQSPICTLINYFTKSPVVSPNTPVVNSLTRQRLFIENFFKMCNGIQPDYNLDNFFSL